jgi:serine/threonine-protein kinase
MSNEEPKTLGSFVLERQLAEGGMGIVYVGRQPALDRVVALKKLRRDLLSNQNLIERFEREARVAASVHHPNVVAVYDCFSFRGSRYIAQEFVDGADLKSVLAAGGPLPPKVAIRIALELARGLEEIHARGIVHRDLKPANVLIGRRGETKIADFGIVLPPSGEGLTEPGTLLGSPPYMAPEQLDGDFLDAKSDMYAFGVVLYEMLCGRVPHPATGEADGAAALRRARRSRYPSLRRLAPATPRALARLVRACLRASPRRRLGSATEVRRRLEALVPSPAPSDCRHEIATWLRDRDVLACEDGHTVALAREPERQTGRWGTLTAIAAAIACACIMTGAVHQTPVAEGGESVAEVQSE